MLTLSLFLGTIPVRAGDGSGQFACHRFQHEQQQKQQQQQRTFSNWLTLLIKVSQTVCHWYTYTDVLGW